MPASEQGDQPAPRRAWLRWLIVALFLAGIGGFYAFGLQDYFSWDHLRDHLGEFKAQVEENLVTAVVVFFLIYIAITALSLPVASILSLLAGALFDRVLGTGVVLLAATCGATLAFLCSRFLLRDWVQARLGQRSEAFNRGVETDGAFYLFSLRLVPLFPFFLVNLGMGLTPIRTWTYFWVSLIGMLPGTFLYINAGFEAKEALATLESPIGILSPGVIISLVLLGIAPLVFRKVMQWRNRA